VAVAAEDEHVALRVLNSTVAVASRWLSALDESEFTLMCLLCSLVAVSVREVASMLSLLHALVVRVEACVRILDDERVLHRDRCRRREVVSLLVFLYVTFGHRLGGRKLTLLQGRTALIRRVYVVQGCCSALVGASVKLRGRHVVG